MDSFNREFLAGLLRLLSAKPIDFLIVHSLMFGVFAGIISLMPFVVKHLPHLIVLLLGFLMVVYLVDSLDIELNTALSSKHLYVVASFVGRYILGCSIGFVIANAIQRIRGEHDHANK